MKRLLPLVALILSASIAFGEDPDLVEGARRATAYWHSLFLQCGNTQGQSEAWYAVTGSRYQPGSIQMVPELRIQFQTRELSQEQRLNGVEFMASTTLQPGPYRWWIEPKKAWLDWQVGEFAPVSLIIKRKGAWSLQAGQDLYDRKALVTCSEVPPMDDKR